jgi:REP element-mobilizing transposase RayT
MKRSRAVEQEFAFLRWGGKRKGAGRKRTSEKGSVPHDARPELAARHPVHVTLRLARGLPSLRQRRSHRVLQDAMRARRERLGLRLVQYSVQSNHVHLVVEADGRESLSRGMQGLTVRMARALNRAWTRAGKVFADRHHAHALRTPREVRNALAYVLQNARKHGARLVEAIDPFSSGVWFDGWVDRPVRDDRDSPVTPARTWLLRVGWRWHGAIRAAPT